MAAVLDLHSGTARAKAAPREADQASGGAVLSGSRAG
jgi:hypothetical protein